MVSAVPVDLVLRCLPDVGGGGSEAGWRSQPLPSYPSAWARVREIAAR